MTDLEIKNAIITGVNISAEDHGILTMWLDLDYGGAAQGAGGYVLYNPNSPEKDACGFFIWRLLEVLERRKVADLKGAPVRVKATHCGVRAIGHLIKDQWFNIAEEIKERAGK